MPSVPNFLAKIVGCDIHLIVITPAAEQPLPPCPWVGKVFDHHNLKLLICKQLNESWILNILHNIQFTS